jgi:integrase
LVFSGFPAQLAHFTAAVNHRLSQAYRPSTHQAHRTACVALALFTLFYDLAFPNISIFTLLSFIEFLNDNNLTVPTIKNYVSSIKTKFSSCNVSVEVFLSPQCTLTLSSLSKNYSPPVSIKPVFTPQQFVRLVTQCARMPLHIFYSTAFIFAYLALLRISNVAPPSSATFNPRRHLRRGDVILHPNYLSIHLRWTKTLQRYRQSARVKLYPIHNSPICPVTAFGTLQRSFPVHPTDPFLSYRSSGQLFIISQSDLRRALKRLVSAISLHSSLTFHSFRRSGASLAYASGRRRSRNQGTLKAAR